VAAALALAVPLARRRPSAGRVADLVIELGSSPRADLLHDLGDLVGDPAVRLGLWYPHGAHYVDTLGRPIDVPASLVGSTVTAIDEAGERLAVLVHAPDVRLDPAVTSAVRSAARLLLAHARLQADVRSQVSAVRASRRRLLVAGDAERARLEARLRDELDPRIEALEESLRAPGLDGDPAATSAREQLHQTRAELDAFISGIGPPDLDAGGLVVALEALAGTAPVPLDVHLEMADIPSRDVRSALVFVAREALANIDKHAGATSATLRLSSGDGSVRLEVGDDGRGGADMARGSGLIGLRDRVEALGGRLTIASPSGRGTLLSASLPLEDPAW
jgi:signal transduction histidine kinase